MINYTVIVENVDGKIIMSKEFQTYNFNFTDEIEKFYINHCEDKYFSDDYIITVTQRESESRSLKVIREDLKRERAKHKD